MSTKTTQMHASSIPTSASPLNASLSRSPMSSSSPPFSRNDNNINSKTTAASTTVKQQYKASSIDDFLNNNEQLHSALPEAVSSSSENDDNYAYEPYSRRDFRIDVTPTSTKAQSNDTSSGYFTSPNENERLPSVSKTLSVLSPDSDNERYETPIEAETAERIREQQRSPSPVESQSGRSASSSHRKSVSFDLDVEEYVTEYRQEDYDERLTIEKSDGYESNEGEQNQYKTRTEPKRIKGILRSPSPGVFVKGNLQKTVVENEYIDDTTDDENPFRKEFLHSGNVIDEQNIAIGNESDEHHNFSSSSTKIPIRKQIFMSTGSFVERQPPPPRPPQPAVNVKVAEMKKNQGLENISKQMDEDDFLEFVHNVETNTIVQVEKPERTSFDPADLPLPPLPKVPPPSLLQKPKTQINRASSVDRPKDSPPPPPTPKSPPPVEEIVEILPARYNVLPLKPKPSHFENYPHNILVTEDEHREILLTENEIRNNILTEYEDVEPIKDNLLTSPQFFSSTNPFLDDISSATSSIISSSAQSTPNVLSPVSTFERTGQQSVQPQPTKILPVHYGQLPKPQQAGYFPLISHNQYTPHQNLLLRHMPPSSTDSSSATSPMNDNYNNANFLRLQHHPNNNTFTPNRSSPSPGTFLSQTHHHPQNSSLLFSPHSVTLTQLPTPQHQLQQQEKFQFVNASNQPNFDYPSTVIDHQQHHQQPIENIQNKNDSYLVSGEGQSNSFYYLYHPNNSNVVNNTRTNPLSQEHQQQQLQYHPQSLLMQSAYVPFTQPSPPINASNYAQMQYVPADPTTLNNNMLGHDQPQFIHYDQQQTQNQQQQRGPELSPIRINPIPNNFVYPIDDDNRRPKSTSLSSFGKQTEV